MNAFIGMMGAMGQMNPNAMLNAFNQAKQDAPQKIQEQNKQQAASTKQVKTKTIQKSKGNKKELLKPQEE